MSEPFIGEIKLVGFNFAPRSFAICAGQTAQISEYSALYALIGTMYGGDGRTTMSLPDLRGRVPVGFGYPPGMNLYLQGREGGVEAAALTLAELPTHIHDTKVESNAATNIITQVLATTDEGDNAAPSSGAYLAKSKAVGGPDQPEKIYKSNPSSGSTHMLGGVESTALTDVDVTVTVKQTGSSAQHSKMQPYLVLNYVIALLGTFPSRN